MLCEMERISNGRLSFTNSILVKLQEAKGIFFISVEKRHRRKGASGGYCSPLIQLIVRVTKEAVSDIHDVPDGDGHIDSGTNVNLVIKSDIPAELVGVIVGDHGTRYVLKARLEVSRLPRPPDPVEVSMVEEEKGVSRARPGIS